jgi:hypothetical protein
VRRAVDVIEGREEETPALAAQWEAEGRAAIEIFREANPGGFVRLVLGLCRHDDNTDTMTDSESAGE